MEKKKLSEGGFKMLKELGRSAKNVLKKSLFHFFLFHF